MSMVVSSGKMLEKQNTHRSGTGPGPYAASGSGKDSNEIMTKEMDNATRTGVPESSNPPSGCDNAATLFHTGTDDDVEHGTKHKDDSCHSSEEVAEEDEEFDDDDLEGGNIRTVYRDMPPSATKSNAKSAADVDSAFEDCNYSGSSDDKTKPVGSACPRVLKSKSRRNHDVRNTTSGGKHRSKDVTEIELQNLNDGIGNTTRCTACVTETEDVLSQELGHPEPELFEMEVSPPTESYEGFTTMMEKGNNKHFLYDKARNPRNEVSANANNNNSTLTALSYHHRRGDTAADSDEESGSVENEGLIRGRRKFQSALLNRCEELPLLSLNTSAGRSVVANASNGCSKDDNSICPHRGNNGEVSLETSKDILPSEINSTENNFDEETLIANMDSGLNETTPNTAIPRLNSVNFSLGGGTVENSPTSEIDKTKDFEVVYVVPDGGWGWMVLLGSIIVNILIPGTVKSFGILFVEFIEVFGATPSEASWIPALSYWLYSSMGPFAGALAIKFSHRSVTIVGGILASAGLMLSYFATSISYLYVSYGLIGGLGAGLAYPVGVFMVGQYFEKRRGLANGLCTSGSALGSVLIPPLLRVLLSEYGYRGAILIMGAILLNVCVGAMFYEPVSKHMKKELIPREKVEPVEESREPTNSPQTSPVRNPVRQASTPVQTTGLIIAPKREIAASLPIAIVRPRKATFQIGQDEGSWSYQSNEIASPLAARMKEDGSPHKWTGAGGMGKPHTRGHLGHNNDSNTDLDALINPTSSSTALPPVNPSTSTTTATSLPGVGTSRGQSRLNLTAIPEDDDNDSESGSRTMEWSFQGSSENRQRVLRQTAKSGSGAQILGSASHSAHPSSITLLNHYGHGLPRTLSMASNVSTSSFHHMNTLHHGSLLAVMQYNKNIPELASNLSLRSAKGSCCPRLSSLKSFLRKLTCGLWPKAEARGDEQDEALEREATLPEPKPKRGDALKKFIDLSLLKDGLYLIMLISNSTTAIGYTNFIILLPAYAGAIGFNKSEAALLLSIVAGFDFIGRIGGAALSDMQFISRRFYYIVGLFMSGIALSFLPCAKTYTAVSLVCGGFGLASGWYIGVTAVLMMDQFGGEKLGSSYGISLFFNGLLQLAGPPICGAVLQHTGQLEPILIGLGITLMFGASLWVFAPFIERHRALKEANANASGSDPQVREDHFVNSTNSTNRTVGQRI